MQRRPPLPISQTSPLLLPSDTATRDTAFGTRMATALVAILLGHLCGTHRWPSKNVNLVRPPGVSTRRVQQVRRRALQRLLGGAG